MGDAAVGGAWNDQDDMTTNSEFVYTKPLVDVVKNGVELKSVDRNIKEKEDIASV